jgi:hypothetical protein
MKSEMSSSAWHSPQQFIIEQDQIRRAEYLAEKADNPSNTSGPVETHLTIVDKPERAAAEPKHPSTSSTSEKQDHGKRYYIDPRSAKAMVSLEDIDVESTADPIKVSKSFPLFQPLFNPDLYLFRPLCPIRQTTRKRGIRSIKKTCQEKVSSDSSLWLSDRLTYPFTSIGSWRSSNARGNRNRTPKSDYGHRNNSNSQQQWRHMHPDDKHFKNQPVIFNYFMEYGKVMDGLENGDLYKCTLRINRRKRMDAYATAETLDGDIYLCGDSARNRALDGDIVAVRLLDVDKVWQQRMDREKRFQEKRQQQQQEQQQQELPQDTETTTSKEEENEGDDDEDVSGGVEIDGMETNDTAAIPIATLAEDDTTTAKENEQDEDDNGDEENAAERKPKYAGEVVYILDRAVGMTYTG